jgi:hypothetical protein
MTPFKKRAILTSGFAGFNIKIYEILTIIPAANEGLVKKQ